MWNDHPRRRGLRSYLADKNLPGNSHLSDKLEQPQKLHNLLVLWRLSIAKIAVARVSDQKLHYPQSLWTWVES